MSSIEVVEELRWLRQFPHAGNRRRSIVRGHAESSEEKDLCRKRDAHQEVPGLHRGHSMENKGRLNHNRNSIKCKPFCQVFNIFNWAPKSKMLALRWCCLIIIRFLPLYTCFFNQYISFRYSWSATEKSKERGLFGVAVSLQSTWHKCGSALKPLQFEKMRVNSVNLFWRTTELSARAPMMGSHKNYVEFVWICHCCHLKLLDTTTFCQTPRQGQK